MAKRNLFFIAMGLLVLGGAFVSANSDEMVLTVDVLATEVGIDVPDRLPFPDIASGYISEAQGFDLVNTGTTNIRVIPSLDESYNGTIFQNLMFDTVKTNPQMVDIDVFDVEVLRPTEAGGTRDQQMYAWLDLTEYTDSIDETLEKHETTLIFTAMPL